MFVCVCVYVCVYDREIVRERDLVSERKTDKKIGIRIQTEERDRERKGRRHR